MFKYKDEEKEKVINFSFSKQNFIDLIVDFITSGQLFNIFKNNGFKNIIQVYLDAFNIKLNRSNISNLLQSEYKKMKDNIIELIKNKFISIKIDGVSIYNRSFIGINI